MRRFVVIGVVVSMLATGLSFTDVVARPAAAASDEDGLPEPDHSAEKPSCSGAVATIVGTSGNDILLGTAGDDVIRGRGGDDVIDGRGGNDVIIGGSGADTLRGGGGADLICGGAGDDSLEGNGGDDRLSGQGGDDVITGGGGADVVFGGTGVDILDGGGGDDLVSGGAGDDELRGSGGSDVVFGDGGGDTLFGGAGPDVLWGGNGGDTLRGGGGDDLLYGSAGNDKLYGNAENDVLYGALGNDRLAGGSGDDVLVGGSGDNDRSFGGAGLDDCDSEVVDEQCELFGPVDSTLGLTYAELGLPVLPDGTFGGTAPGTDPVQVAMAPNFDGGSPTVADASSICAAGGALGISYYPIESTPIVYGRLTVPAGMSVSIDVTHFKERVNTGGWSGEIVATRIDSDGQLAGGNAGRKSFISPFNWNPDFGGPGAGAFLRNDDLVLFTNTGDTGDFVIKMESYGAVSIGLLDGDSWVTVSDLKYQVEGVDVGPVCQLDELVNCQIAGGNFLVTEPVELDGQIYQGCIKYEPCSANWNFYGAENFAEFLCRNDRFLAAILLAAILVVVVIGGIYVVSLAAGAASGAVGGTTVLSVTTAAKSTGATIASLSVPITLQQAAIGTLTIGVATLPRTRSGGEAIVAGLPDMADIAGTVQDAFSASVDYFRPDAPGTLLDYPNFEFDTVLDVYRFTGPTVADRVAADLEIDVRIEDILVVEVPNNNPTVRSRLRDELTNVFKTAISTCVVEMAAGDVISAIRSTISATINLPAGVDVSMISDRGAIELPGDNEHICESIPIYMPGARALNTGTPIAQATLHISEALGQYDATNWPNTWVDRDGGVQTPPNAGWTFLHRAVKTSGSGWQANPPHNCQGVGLVTNCDEWPWFATAEGGPDGTPRPNLRILAGGHNRASGRELGSFYAQVTSPTSTNRIGCGVGDGELFMTVPVNAALLIGDSDAITPDTVVNVSQVRSRSICP